MQTVTLKGLEIEITPPESMAAAYDVAAAVGRNALRGTCAALGLCWAGKQRLRSKFADTYNALEYGGQVFDELTAWGAKPAEIHAAGEQALIMVCDGLPGADEVAAEEGNSEAPEDSTLP